MPTQTITDDLSLAAALHCLGIKVDAQKGDHKNSVEFLVEKSKRIEQLTSSFYNKNLQVDALTYFDSVKTLKLFIKNITNN